MHLKRLFKAFTPILLIVMLLLPMVAQAQALPVSEMSPRTRQMLSEQVQTGDAVTKAVIATTSVKLNKTKITLEKKDKTYQLKATVSPSSQKKTLKWASSNAAVAKVSTTGKVTAVAAGQVYIYAYTKDDTVGYCQVTVKGKTPTKPSKSDMYVKYSGKTIKLPASFKSLKTQLPKFGQSYMDDGYYYFDNVLYLGTGSYWHTALCFNDQSLAYAFAGGNSQAGKSPFATNRGIKVGAKWSSVVSAYGQPHWVFSDKIQGVTYKLYSYELPFGGDGRYSLDFLVDSKKKTVVNFTVNDWKVIYNSEY